ncbi:MAG: hypothetical protein FWD18_11495 [Micrococcales bacterium]|nr:hypothetical protein [Micrococcales bacterium]
MGYYYCFARAEDELWAFGEGQDWEVVVGPQVVGGLDDHSQVLAQIAKEGAVEGLAGEAMLDHFLESSEMLGLLSKVNADMLKLLFHANRVRAKAHVAWENLPPAEPTQSMLDKFIDIFDPADRVARARQEADTKRQAAAAARLGELREELNEIGMQILNKAQEAPEWIPDIYDSIPGWTDPRKEPASVMSFPRPEQTVLRLPGGQGEGSQTWSAPLPSSPVPALGHPGLGPSPGAADGGTAGAGTLPGAAGGGAGASGFDAAGRALNAGAGGGAALAGGRMLAGQAGVGAGGVGGAGSLGGAGAGGAPGRVPGQGLRGAFGTAGAGGLPAGGAGASGVGAAVPGAGGAPVGGMVGGAPGAGQQPARRPGEGLKSWGGTIVPKWEDDPDWEPLPPEFLGSDENDL